MYDSNSSRSEALLIRIAREAMLSKIFFGDSISKKKTSFHARQLEYAKE